MNLNWIYTGISWILLRWHDLWGGLLHMPSGPAWVLSIVFLVLTVRVVLFPVFVRQIKSQRAMQAIQPQMKELREKYKNDQQKLQAEMMELYKREKANPLMGCLPIFLQIPVFIGLFHVLRLINPNSDSAFKAMTTEYGWTADQFNSASEARIFGAPIAAAFRSTTEQLEQLDASRLAVTLVAGILIITMVATTYITQRQMIARNGVAADPTQAMVQKLMLYGIPASLLVSGAIFPIGVVVYWVTQNFFSMGQQFWVLSKMPLPKPGDPKVDPEKAAAMAPKPGVKPVNPKKGGRPAAARQPSSGSSVKFDTAQARAERASAAEQAAKAAEAAASETGDAEKPAPVRKPTPARGGGGARRPQDNRNRKRKGGRR
ncbi:membrane protein insertase YidC [Cryptosporangium phraense]|uniref:Membrane protein insertase YidC n=1 Tax=Cryptosporangium phraense TaxID=2593070 RepID=A0A545AJG0_9ACTN|nr:membrane protein insertase YidC [Cryptosporangium phraense]TQS41463.1 membrane protein insertase YidC [Cryptosporangium phraense]